MAVVDTQDLTQPTGPAAPADDAASVDKHPVGDEPEAPVEEPSRRPPSAAQLRRERKRLWNDRQETIYHVGGLAVELRRRGMLDEGLIARRADIVLDADARILEIDAQLAAIDEGRRSARVRMPKPHGYCLSCGGPYLADAQFCSRCGARVHVPPDEGQTQTLPVVEPDET